MAVVVSIHKLPRWKQSSKTPETVSAKCCCLTNLVRYTRGELLLLDQLKLPFEFEYLTTATCEEAWKYIRNMNVRGAPAIAIAAALALAVESIAMLVISCLCRGVSASSLPVCMTGSSTKTLGRNSVGPGMGRAAGDNFMCVR